MRPPEDPMGVPWREPLFATKLHIPRVRANFLARPRLTERLDEALTGRFILVSAPAGFGKTALLSAWVAGHAFPSAWLTLDADDNQPVRFASGLAAAVDEIAPGKGMPLRRALAAARVRVDGLVTALAESLADLTGDRLLVLDDYHVIEEPDVHRALEVLFDNLPPNLHLALVTRADPPLPTGGPRARGDLHDIRADDLRFTLSEANAYLNQVLRLNLAHDDVGLLAARTEGWIAALHLAALALGPRARRARSDVAQLLQGCARADCSIFDYLAKEVLARQPERVQAFLLQTSILDELCSALCEAVTGEAGGQALLDVLDSRQLFLSPLDDDRVWYRYHDLFAGLLRARLDESGVERVAQLHGRAGAWYASQGLPRAAARHERLAG